MRIFEQECMQAVIETQKEVQSQNIDALVEDEPMRNSIGIRAAHEVKTIKYVTNQLLDKSGMLLKEH